MGALSASIVTYDQHAFPFRQVLSSRLQFLGSDYSTSRLVGQGGALSHVASFARGRAAGVERAWYKDEIGQGQVDAYLMRVEDAFLLLPSASTQHRFPRG